MVLAGISGGVALCIVLWIVVGRMDRNAHRRRMELLHRRLQQLSDANESAQD